MSDSMSNVEIEDVLSSIRRLVAEGDKIKQEKKREYGDLSAPVERLVLTPAHRVEATQPEPDASDNSDVVPAEDGGHTFNNAEASEPENERAENSEIFVGEPHAVNEADAIETAFEPAEIEAPSNVQPLILKNENAANPRESLEATIAALEAAVEGDPTEFEPDGSEVSSTPSWGDTQIAAFNSRRDDDVAESETVSTAPAAVSEQIENPDQHPEDEAESPAVLSPESRIFRVIPDTPPEEVVREIHESAVKPGEAISPVHPDVLEEDYGDDLIGGETRELASDDNLEAALTENILMDEEVMRKLVSEVLKGELEGKLGDTITRNVRKLVRREIHRVLTHQELE